MPRFKAEVAKRKIDPLILHGRCVSLSYENTRAFETRKVERTFGKYGDQTYSYNRSRMPSKELLDWMATHVGPRGVLWTAEKQKSGEGIDIYFALPAKAMLFKLTWANL